MRDDDRKAEGEEDVTLPIPFGKSIHAFEESGAGVLPSCGWYAIARYNHTRRRRILLEKLNLPIYNNRDVPNSTPQLKVRVISDYNFEE